MNLPKVTVYTDGACSGNPGPGGWGAVIIGDGAGGEVVEKSGGEMHTTNQRMELQAAIEALRALPGPSRVRLHSDSAYLVNAFRRRWIPRWQANGWRTAANRTVQNQDLWRELLTLTSKHQVEWLKVKGHSGDSYNERCDELARRAIPSPDKSGGVNRTNRYVSVVSGKWDKQVRPRCPGGGEAMRRLGILTGGGDCPGLNAVIRAVAKSAFFRHDIEVVGFNNGFKGLVENEAWLIGEEAVSGILHRGGTILGTTNRDNPFHYRVTESDGNPSYEDRSADALRHLNEWDLDGLIVIGGDGSLTLADRFSKMGVPVIGIPKTIDNDLSATDVTFGFDTAAATATEAIDRLHTTAESHHRVMVLEVMGRNAGWIALQAGMAGGGDIILIPELPFDYGVIIEKIMQRRDRGKKFSIVVAAEGAFPEGGSQVYQLAGETKRLGGIGQMVAGELEKRTGMESRATVLGHLQRGGTPTVFDRVLATRFGVAAVELARAGRWNEMVCLQGGMIESVSLADAVAEIKRIDPGCEQIQAALAVGTSFGRTI